MSDRADVGDVGASDRAGRDPRLMDETAIHDLVTRLARPLSAGGHVIERAAILAAGHECTAIEAWIVAHAGEPEQTVRPRRTGLHARQLAEEDNPVRRFVFPRGVL